MEKNKLDLEFDKDEIYWAYNLPLQMWPIREDPENEKSEIIEYNILNYMPRKSSCAMMENEIDLEHIPRYCRNTAKLLRNLANLFEALAEKKIDTIYYPDKIF